MEDLCCPCLGKGYEKGNQCQCLLWIVSHAVSVEYEDNRKIYRLELRVDDKFNTVKMETELSPEEEHHLTVLRSWLLKIANFLNVSIVDENEISAILDVSGCLFVCKYCVDFDQGAEVHQWPNKEWENGAFEVDAQRSTHYRRDCRFVFCFLGYWEI